MQLYLAASPHTTPRPWKGGRIHMAYCVDREGALLRSALTESLQGGLLGLSIPVSPPAQSCGALCDGLLAECRQHAFAGVFADWEADGEADWLPLLEERLSCAGRTLYLPEAVAPCTRQSGVLICTALSGGSLRQRLQEAIARWGVSRVVVDVQRLCMDFPLPCPDGEGRLILPTQKSVQEKLRSARSFYSQELCARYYTYLAPDGGHLVLYDDAATLRSKLRLAQSLGIKQGFFMYPEVSDILPQLGV